MKAKLLFIMLVSLGLSINTIAQILNGDMDPDVTPWVWQLSIVNTGTTTPGEATRTYEAYSDPANGHFLQVVVTAANTDASWNLRVKQDGIVVPADVKTLQFKARCANGSELLRLRLQDQNNGNAQLFNLDNISLTTEWKTYQYDISQGGAPGKEKVTLSFMTKSVGTYQFDDVEFVSTPTGISDDVMDDVKVWYAASTNMLNIDGITANSVSVYSLCGAKVAEYNAPGSTLTLGQIPSGLYVVSVATDAGTKVVKIKK